MEEWVSKLSVRSDTYEDICYSPIFYNKEDAIKEVVEDCKYAFDEDSEQPDKYMLCVGRVLRYTPDIDGYSVIEQLQEDAYDECGEASADFLDELFIDSKLYDDFQEHMNKALENWLKSNNMYPSFYAVTDIEEIDPKEYVNE